jgi:hypothetical protein
MMARKISHWLLRDRSAAHSFDRKFQVHDLGGVVFKTDSEARRLLPVAGGRHS